MKWTLLIVSILISQSSFADNCFQFDKQDYCEAWKKVEAGVSTVELVQKDESVSAWSKMITVRKYDNKKALKEVLPSYFKSVKPLFAMKPDILAPDDVATLEEVYLRMLLLAPDKSHYEYVVNRFYRDDENSVKSIFYSHRIPFSEEVDFTEVMEKRDNWLEQLRVSSIDTYITK